MPDLIAVIFLETILYYLVRYPGAAIRWAILGAKRPYHEVLEHDTTSKNIFTGMLSLTAILIAYALLIK